MYAGGTYLLLFHFEVTLVYFSFFFIFEEIEVTLVVGGAPANNPDKMEALWAGSVGLRTNYACMPWEVYTTPGVPHRRRALRLYEEGGGGRPPLLHEATSAAQSVSTLHPPLREYLIHPDPSALPLQECQCPPLLINPHHQRYGLSSAAVNSTSCHSHSPLQVQGHSLGLACPVQDTKSE